MKKNSFTFIGGAAALVSALLIFGVFQMNSSANGIISQVALGGDTAEVIKGILNNIYVLIFAVVATLTIAVALFVYYIFEEREMSFLIIGTFGLAEVILFITALNDIGTKISNLYGYYTSSGHVTVSSLLGSSFSTPSEILGLTPIMVVAIVEFIFIMLVFLQMNNKVHIGFIAKYAPKNQNTIVNENTVNEENNIQEEGGEA